MRRRGMSKTEDENVVLDGLSVDGPHGFSRPW